MAKYAKLLLGCYRTGDANDPEVYTAAVIAVLADYPVDIIERVVDPRTGLPSRINWLPTVQEVRKACNEIYAPRQWAAEWDRGAAAQLAAREQEEEARKLRPTYDELKAQGIIKPRPQGLVLPAQTLWLRWRDQRWMRGITLSPEARAVLKNAGYDPDGPNDQEPVRQAAA